MASRMHVEAYSAPTTRLQKRQQEALAPSIVPNAPNRPTGRNLPNNGRKRLQRDEPSSSGSGSGSSSGPGSSGSSSHRTPDPDSPPGSSLPSDRSSQQPEDSDPDGSHPDDSDDPAGRPHGRRRNRRGPCCWACFACIVIVVIFIIDFVSHAIVHEPPGPGGRDVLQCIVSTHGDTIIPQSVWPGLSGVMLTTKLAPDTLPAQTWLDGVLPISTPDRKRLQEDSELAQLLISLESHTSAWTRNFLDKRNKLQGPARENAEILNRTTAALDRIPRFLLLDAVVCGGVVNLPTMIPTVLDQLSRRFSGLTMEEKTITELIREKRSPPSTPWSDRIASLKDDCRAAGLQNSPLGALMWLVRAAHVPKRVCPKPTEKRASESLSEMRHIVQKIKSIIFTRLSHMAREDADFAAGSADPKAVPYVRGTTRPLFPLQQSHEDEEVNHEDEDGPHPQKEKKDPRKKQPKVSYRSNVHALYRLESPHLVYGQAVPREETRSKMSDLAKIWSLAVWAEWLVEIEIKFATVEEAECAAVEEVYDGVIGKALDGVFDLGNDVEDQKKKAMRVLNSTRETLMRGMREAPITGLFAPNLVHGGDDVLSSFGLWYDDEQEQDDDSLLTLLPDLTEQEDQHRLSPQHSPIFARLWRYLTSTSKAFLRAKRTPQGQNETVEQCLMYPLVPCPADREGRGGGREGDLCLINTFNHTTKARDVERNARGLAKAGVWEFWLKGVDVGWVTNETERGTWLDLNNVVWIDGGSKMG